jgi:Lon protease-like protein
MAELAERFPLFPLGIVCLPGELVPLHIFEERYKLMIGECIHREREFGIVWLADDGLRSTGCACAVARVLERMEDGRMNVAVRGTRVLRLVRRLDDMPYPAGDVELLDDAPSAAADLDDAGALARERYATLVTRASGEPPDADEVATLTAYGMAARIELPLASKQALLELRAEAARLRLLADQLADALERLAYVERTSEQARSNGHLRR